MWKSRFILMRSKKAELEAREKLENGTYVYKGLTEAEVENQVPYGQGEPDRREYFQDE